MAKTNQELAQEQLDSMGIPWKGAEMKPFSPSINPFNPNFRATIGSKLREWIDDSGIGGGYRQGLINAGEGIETAIDFTPIVGDAVGVGDIRTSYNQGDMLGTGINTVAAAVGALPIVGDVAAKGVKKIGSSLREIDGIKQIGGVPLEGAPSRPNIPELGTVQIGPNPQVEEAAQQYSALSGVPYTPMARYTRVDQPRAEMVAREYDRMLHSPEDPEVQRAYQQMINETMGQYDQMLAQGIEPYFINDVDPYAASPYLSLIDMAENNRLGVFPTRSGFGSNADFDPKNNPLLAKTGYTISGQPALANDIFRAVHDYYGHGKSGVGFRAMGEENAYQSHAGLYSPLARRALASETRGQNSWLNYGPYGESNRTASIDDTVFADQKTGLMPRYASESGLIINDDKRERFFDALRRGETGLEGAITDDGKLRIIHRSNQPIERVDPEMYGGGLSKRSAERNRAGSPDFVKRSYYGIPASENPYRREVGIGSIQNEVLIEPELLYDARKDPDKLWIPNDPTGSEKRIADSNYTGYFVDHPKLGKVASIFDPYDVTKTYMIPLATGAGALGAVSSLRDMQEESTQPQPAL